MLKGPNHTQIPNQFIERYMNILRGSETAVFLAICRKTLGWHKDTDAISISQLKILTGFSNRAILDAIENLEEHGLIVAEKAKGKTTKYTINYDASSEKSSQDLCNKFTGTYEESSHTKERKENNKRNSRENHLQELLDYFYQKHDEEKGFKPKWGAKETMLLKKDIERCKEVNPVEWRNMFKAFVNIFLRGADEKIDQFAKHAGYGYNIFHGQLEKMIARTMRNK